MEPSNIKPRVQGKIANLPPQQREQVHSWMRENLIYKEIARRIQSEFGVKIAPSAVCAYYRAHNKEILSPSGMSESSAVESREIRLIVHFEIRPVLAPAIHGRNHQ